jgi:hypothetical protein
MMINFKKSSDSNITGTESKGSVKAPSKPLCVRYNICIYYVCFCVISMS